jgi:uncharacterized Fe-S cluster protein YjdI
LIKFETNLERIGRKKMTKTYKTEDLTITWKPNVCIHSTICFKGLPHVFNPREKPWIKTENTNTEELINQIKKCPSGALSYKLTNKSINTNTMDKLRKSFIINYCNTVTHLIFFNKESYWLNYFKK